MQLTYSVRMDARRMHPPRRRHPVTKSHRAKADGQLAASGSRDQCVRGSTEQARPLSCTLLDACA